MSENIGRSHVPEGAEFAPVDQVTKIEVPEEVAEESKITGFAFSSRLLELTGLEKMEIPQSVVEGKEPFEYAEVAEALAFEGDVTPVHGENWIRVYVSDRHENAGSKTDYIWLYFGRNKKIKLWGKNKAEFPKGATITWDLNLHRNFIETVKGGGWDNVSLLNPSGDGMLVDRIQIRHSSETILDWRCRTWLDGSKLEKYSGLGLGAKILETKLGRVGNAWQPQIHWAAREIGKTDYTKYGTGTVWCSEFASWCLRKALWDTPVGSFGSGAMEKFFADRGRKFTKAQVTNGEYKPVTGDYLRFPNHSALFVKYLGANPDPTDDTTKMLTIDGNVSSTVGLRKRSVGSLISVGCTR